MTADPVALARDVLDIIDPTVPEGARILASALLEREDEIKRLREALDWIEAEPEDPHKVQLWARAALRKEA